MSSHQRQPLAVQLEAVIQKDWNRLAPALWNRAAHTGRSVVRVHPNHLNDWVILGEREYSRTGWPNAQVKEAVDGHDPARQIVALLDGEELEAHVFSAADLGLPDPPDVPPAAAWGFMRSPTTFKRRSSAAAEKLAPR
jgi:hypothetical protein